MKNSFVVRRAILSLTLAFTAFPAAAQLLGTTARQSSKGSLKFLAYYQGVADQNLNFSVDGSGICNAAPPNGGVAFPCSSSGDVEAKGSGGAGILKVIWAPAERFQLYAQVGTGDYSIKVPSTTVENTLSGDKLGLIFGAGLKASIVPDTIVNPAIALDLNITRSHYNFNRNTPGGTPGISGFAANLDLMTYQVAIETSHLFTIDENWKLEPYGGVKWTRVQADLKDLAGGSHAGGQKDTGTPFLGLRVPAEDRIAFFGEAAFIDGLHYGGGLELRFK